MRFRLIILYCLLLVSGKSSLFGQYSTSDFSYYKTVTINADLSAAGSTPHGDFPVLISIDSDSDLINGWGGQVQSAYGFDIIFFDDAGNQLDHEIEYYQSWNGQYVAWVRIPSLDPTITTQIFMYYGNSNINSDPSLSTTWNSDYEVVLHLEDDDLNESAGNYNNINQNNTWLIYPASDPAIGRSRGFSGWDNYIEVPKQAINSNGVTTFSFWARFDNLYNRTLFDAGHSNKNKQDYYTFYNGNEVISFYEDSNDSDIETIGTISLSTDTWTYFSIENSFNDNIQKIYVNGILVGSQNINAGSIGSLRNILFGSSTNRSYNNSNSDFDGAMDEIRISSISRSSDWIATEYANQNTPGSFVTFGLQQEVGAAVDFIISATVSDVTCNGLSDGSATLTISGGAAPYNVSWSNGQSGETLSGVAAATYTATITDDNGVTETYDVTIGEPGLLVFTVLNTMADPCGGNCDGEFTYSITGGTMPYNLSWDSSPINSSGFSKDISFTGNEYLEDYQLELTVAYESNMENDFSDLRFMDSGSTPLNFWIEEFTASTSATVWVKIPVINTGANSITMTYGDASASGGSDFENTMNNGGLNAEYYYYGTGSSGPVIDPTKLITVCEDITTTIDNRPIDHDWGSGAIDLCGQSYSDYVLISWYGWLKKPDDATGETFNLRCGSDDGFRLMLGNDTRTSPTVQFWNLRSYGTNTGTFTFSENIIPITFDFWENTGFARTTFEWYYPGGPTSYQTVPQSQFYYAQYSSNPPSDISFTEEQTTNIFTATGQCSGTQNLTVIDANGCTDTGDIVIPTDEVLLTATVSDISCNGLSDGNIDVSVSCGIAPYVVSWDNGSTELSLSGLSAGDYTVTVTDQNGSGNSVSETYTIHEPDPLIFTLTPVINYVSQGECTASFDYTIIGGTPPFTLDWTPTSFSDFLKQREITFSATEALTDYQVAITIPYDDDMQDDFDDIRFVDLNGNALSFWIEEYTQTVQASVWVRVPTILVGTNTIVLVYGNATATNASDITSTMTNGGLLAKYYADPGAGRSPDIDEANRVATCIDDGTVSQDRPIDHNWGSGVVDLCGQSFTNDVQISWEGWLKKPDDATGDNFQIRGGSDDGFRVMLDSDRSNPTLSYWNDRGYSTTSGSYTFSKEIIPIIFDWYENGGGARVTFEWNYPGNGSWEMVPQSQYYYRMYSDNPPTNIVIGNETDVINHQTGVCGGTHVYTVTDQNGCTATQTFTVDVIHQNSPGGVFQNLEVWLRADKETYTGGTNTIASHNEPVSEWSGFSTIYNATQADINLQPKYRTSGAEQINYNGYITFDGIDDFSVLNRTAEQMETENTIFIVINAHHYLPVIKLGENAYISIGNNIEYRTSGSASTITAGNELNLDTWYLVSMVKSGDNSGDIRFFIQGEETAYATTANSAITPSGNIEIGKYGGSYLMAHVAEIIIYKSALTTEQRQKVESYLAVKYGITM